MPNTRTSRFLDARPLDLIKTPLRETEEPAPESDQKATFKQKMHEIQSRIRKNAYSQATHPTEVSGIALHVVWDVDANAAYDVPGWLSRMSSVELYRQGGTGLIALRTHEGLGRIYLDSGKVIEADSSSLVIVEWDHLRRYHCVGDLWRFWWFEFIMMGPRPFPLNQRLHLPAYPEDEREFQELFMLLRRPSDSQARLASAYFTKLLYHWLATWEQTGHETPQRRQMLSVIDLMHEKITQNWTVEENGASRTHERAHLPPRL